MASKWKVFDWIKTWNYPKWLKPIIQNVNDAMVAIALKVGQDFIQKARYQIVSLYQDKSLTSEQKIRKFKDWSIMEMPGIKDQVINCLREFLYLEIKKVF